MMPSTPVLPSHSPARTRPKRDIMFEAWLRRLTACWNGPGLGVVFEWSSLTGPSSSNPLGGPSPIISEPGGVIPKRVGTLRGERTQVSFQAYLDNIKAKTGKTPAQLRALAAKAGVYSPDMKASELVAWLKKEFDLGQGHSMAIWKVFKDEGWVRSPTRKK